MRKSARNRIIIWSIVSVLLIGLLTVGIIGIRNYKHSISNFSVFQMMKLIKCPRAMQNLIKMR